MADRIVIQSEKMCDRCGRLFPYPYQHQCVPSEAYMKSKKKTIEAKRKTMWPVVMMAVMILSPSIRADQIQTEQISEFSKVVDAIYIVEGGSSTRFPFGIKSVKCEGYDECRHVAYRTVRNNHKRWEDAGKEGEYLDFLANRYCPIADDPIGNKNWKNNMRRILNA